MKAPRYGSVEYWRNAVAEQVAWMEKCGGNLAGYVEKYGSKDDPEHSGNGGEAIYQADYNHLDYVTQRFNRAVWNKQRR